MPSKLLNGTGGSTKGIGIFHSWKTLLEEYDYKPDFISGISVSALMKEAFALGKIKELEELMNNFTIDYIFDHSPVNKKGGLTPRAIFRAVTGKPSVGTTCSLEKILRELVTESDFKRYQSQDKYAACYSMSVDFKSGSRIIVNTKELESYDDYIKHSIASASIPVFTEPVLLNDMVLYDGGIRDHSLGHWAMEELKPNEVRSIWSRPENYDISDLDWEPKNVIEVVERTIDIQTMEISKGDEFKEKQIAEKYGMDYRAGFLPKVLKSLYDTDRNRLNLLALEGEKLAHKMYNL